MPRLLFYVVLTILVVLWAKRFVRVKIGRTPGSSTPPGTMPKRLVCGACSTAYDPHASGWICPKCGK